MRMFIAAALSFVFAGPATAQLYLGHGEVVGERRTSESGTQDFGFGRAVIRHADQLIVGAAGPGMGSGGAVVFHRREAGSWTEFQRIESEPASDSLLGHSLAMVGDLLLVGEPAARSADGLEAAGAVRVFSFDAEAGVWTQVATLTEPEPAAAAFFGHALAYAADTLFVAAPYTEPSGPFGTGGRLDGALDGRIYAYRRDAESGGWTQVQLLRGGHGDLRSGFGLELAASDTHVVIAAPYERLRGAVYVYSLDPIGATLVGRLDEEANGFGRAVSIAGNRIVVGATAFAYSELAGSNLRGDAYVYEVNDEGIARVATLFEDASLFGWSVLAMDESRILIGAPGNGGSVFQFVADGAGAWSLAQQLTAPIDTIFRPTGFGEVLAFTGGEVYVGSPTASHDMGSLPEFSKSGALHELPLLDPPIADLGVALSAPEETEYGSSIPVNVFVTGDARNGVDLAYLNLRTELTVLGAPEGCFELREAILRCELGAVATGETRVMELVFRAPHAGELDVNRGIWAYLGAELADPDTDDNRGFHQVRLIDIVPPGPAPDTGGGAFGWLTALFLLTLLRGRKCAY